MAVPELDLAYGAPDLPLADPLGENAWLLLLGQWLGHLQGNCRANSRPVLTAWACSSALIRKLLL
ncbi:hypothetical protein AAF134_11075 [Synechococcus lacustris Tous-12m]